MNNDEDKLTHKQAFNVIFGSAFLVVISFFAIWYGYRSFLGRCQRNHDYDIVAIVQRSHSRDVIPTKYLAELLHLSSDQPTNLYHFSTKIAKQDLEATLAIRKAKVHRIPPNVVLIDYWLRTPYAMIADYKNVAIDKHCLFFPIDPFMQPKQVPEIYLGGKEKARLELAVEVMKSVQDILPDGFLLKRVDVGGVFFGNANREIVLFVEQLPYLGSLSQKYALRLYFSRYKESLEYFLRLCPTIEALGRKAEGIEKELKVVDLRVPQLALVK